MGLAFSTMRVIPIDEFGRDHYSLLLYVESRCVDNAGIPAAVSMRCNVKRHPGLGTGSSVAVWRDEWSTRLRGGKRAKGHDDWDCFADMAAVGWVCNIGTGVNPKWYLTEVGWCMAHLVRRWKAAGNQVKDFCETHNRECST